MKVRFVIDSSATSYGATHAMPQRRSQRSSSSNLRYGSMCVLTAKPKQRPVLQPSFNNSSLEAKSYVRRRCVTKPSAAESRRVFSFT